MGELNPSADNQTKSVCEQCFDDLGISEFIENNAVSKKCYFCGASADVPIAASIQEVADYINECIKTEYDDAANEVPYISREGGYQLPTWDSYELLSEIELEFPNDERDELFFAIARRLDDNSWCHWDPFRGSDEDVAKYSWQHFAWVTKHQRRFFFMDHRSEFDLEEDSPGAVLKTIFEYANEAGLFKTLPTGTRLFRARWEGDGDKLETAEELGPPPEAKATQSNRMSPPGIVMFYAGEDKETAILETANAPGQFAIGCFETLRSGIVLDLADIPRIPSLFEAIPEGAVISPRTVLTFLRQVSAQISQRIARDNRTNVDYVPTQIVTEYVRSQLTSGGTQANRTRVDGIKYSSSVHPGHASYVLFATQDDILPVNEPTRRDDRWLKLVSVSHHSANLSLLDNDNSMP